MKEFVVCPVCGFRYESTAEGACQECPLNPSCAMACCPACGHSTINPQKSTLVRWVQKWLHPQAAAVQAIPSLVAADRPVLSSMQPDGPESPEWRLTLDQVEPGQTIHLAGFSGSLALQHRLRLRAFGLEPGHSLEVIQQRPVTIVKTDHLELAIEGVLARGIYVQA